MAATWGRTQGHGQEEALQDLCLGQPHTETFILTTGSS